MYFFLQRPFAIRRIRFMLLKSAATPALVENVYYRGVRSFKVKCPFFLSFQPPPREIRQANLWKVSCFALHQRCLISASFNIYLWGTFHHIIQRGFPSPPVCGCELWSSLDMHTMLCPSYICRLLWSNKAAEQSWCVAVIAAWRVSANKKNMSTK